MALVIAYTVMGIPLGMKKRLMHIDLFEQIARACVFSLDDGQPRSYFARRCHCDIHHDKGVTVMALKYLENQEMLAISGAAAEGAC